MRPSRLIAAAGALGLAAAAGSPVAVAWGPPQRASAGPEDARSPDVAVSPAGDAIAAWVQERGGRGTVVAAAAPAGRRWSAPRRISPPGLAAIDPAVATLPGGGGIVVWRQAGRTRVLRGRRQAVYVARARELTAAGRWGPVEGLSDPLQKVGEPQVAVDGRGTAVAAWHWGTGTRAGTPGHVGQIQVSEKPPGGAWTRARRASGARGCGLDTRLPRVAAGAGGHAVVWWQCDLPRGRSGARGIGRGPSPAAWSAERRLPFDVPGDQVADIAVEPGGAIVAVSPGRRGALAAWRGPAPLGAAGALGLAPVSLPALQPLARDGGRLSVAASTAGAIAGWIGPRGLGVADIGAAGTVDRVTALGGPLAARRGARVASLPAGPAVAVALARGGVVATSRGNGGAWAPLERISAAGAVADAVVSAWDQVATAYWSRRSGGRSVVERAESRLAP
jgi:hypothetical protein